MLHSGIDPHKRSPAASRLRRARAIRGIEPHQQS